jgi:ubiquinone/menaquinone biosynthesis C-methylase UbiE
MDELFYELFNGLCRFGPGSDEATLKALKMVKNNQKEIQVLDIGCGTGAQTFVLAKNLTGQIIALDNYQPFLNRIEERIIKEQLTADIRTVCMDMKQINFEKESLDLVWAEGSIYIIGFENGLNTIYPMLKDDAYVVFSDMNYFKPDPPEALASFLKQECLEVISLDENLELIDKSPYELVDHFKLGMDGHWLHYYEPLQNRVVEYLAKYNDHPVARNIAVNTQQEIDLYRKYNEYYGYVFYIMKKTKG